MPTQSIGKIRVVVNNDSLGPLKVKQSTQMENRVRTINYGQPLEVSKAIDVDMSGAETGEALVYNSTSAKFEVSPVTANTATYANTANTVLLVQGGTF